MRVPARKQLQVTRSESTFQPASNFNGVFSSPSGSPKAKGVWDAASSSRALRCGSIVNRKNLVGLGTVGV